MSHRCIFGDTSCTLVDVVQLEEYQALASSSDLADSEDSSALRPAISKAMRDWHLSHAISLARRWVEVICRVAVASFASRSTRNFECVYASSNEFKNADPYLRHVARTRSSILASTTEFAYDRYSITKIRTVLLSDDARVTDTVRIQKVASWYHYVVSRQVITRQKQSLSERSLASAA